MAIVDYYAERENSNYFLCRYRHCLASVTNFRVYHGAVPPSPIKHRKLSVLPDDPSYSHDGRRRRLLKTPPWEPRILHYVSTAVPLGEHKLRLVFHLCSDVFQLL